MSIVSGGFPASVSVEFKDGSSPAVCLVFRGGKLVGSVRVDPFGRWEAFAWSEDAVEHVLLPAVAPRQDLRSVVADLIAELDGDADTGEAILARAWVAVDAERERVDARRRVEEIDRDLSYLNFRLIDITGAKYARAVAEIDRLSSLKASARALAGLPEADEPEAGCPANCPGCGGQGCPTY